MVKKIINPIISKMLTLLIKYKYHRIVVVVVPEESVLDRSEAKGGVVNFKDLHYVTDAVWNELQVNTSKVEVLLLSTRSIKEQHFGNPVEHSKVN